MQLSSGILERVRRWIGFAAAGSDTPAKLASPDESPVQRAASLHVLIDDGLLRVSEGQLALTRTDGSERLFRLHELAQVSIHGQAGMTTPALKALLNEGCPVIWRDRAGRYIGQSVDLSGRNTEVRRAQYNALAEPARRLEIARTFVVAKITNTRGLLRRRDTAKPVLERLGKLADAACVSPAHASLMGCEGTAAAISFGEWPRMIGAAQGFRFPGRGRRPAGDPVNAMLNYAYAILAGDCAAAALAAGLDPHAGFLHAERPGRPALALDMMEPLRPLIAERAVLRALNRREVTLEDFVAEGPAIRLSDHARRTLIAGMEARFAEAAPGGGDYRSALQREAGALATALRANTAFVPTLLRA